MCLSRCFPQENVRLLIPTIPLQLLFFAKSLNLSESLIPHLENGNHNTLQLFGASSNFFFFNMLKNYLIPYKQPLREFFLNTVILGINR